MKTVIATEDGQITSDSTSNARLVSFKKGEEVVLNDMQADFLVECGKAEHKKADVKDQPIAPIKKTK